MELVKSQNLKILNTSKKCTGLWTWVKGEKKSVLDYMIIEAENEDLVREMWIDSDREYTPKHLVDGRYVYTDHNHNNAGNELEYEVQGERKNKNLYQQ